jgi:rhomboid protease GluP
MLRKSTGAILCPSCGRITSAEAERCALCGRARPGMWGFGDTVRRLFRGNASQTLALACIVLYVVSLLLDPRAALRPVGLFSFLAPGARALQALGMTGSYALADGRWWTLLTAIYLHGGLLHIVFNVMWIRQLGPAVEEQFGSARLVTIFTVSGAVGFVLSALAGVPFTIGASGSIFGLLGAMVAYGRRRGGAFGTLVLRQYGQWALVLFLFGLLMGGMVNNFAHAGGFIGGFVCGLVMSLAERRKESLVDWALALACVAATLVAFALSLVTAFG